MSSRRQEMDRRVEERRREVEAQWRRLQTGTASETGLVARGWPVALIVVAATAGLVFGLARKRS